MSTTRGFDALSGWRCMAVARVRAQCVNGFALASYHVVPGSMSPRVCQSAVCECSRVS